MALTGFSFTNDLSDAVAFAGITKIKCDDIPEGGSVILLEERNDSDYEIVNGKYGPDWSVIGYGETSRLFDLHGSYKVKRSHSSISVGYETTA